MLVTHAHPDHTFALTQMLGGADVPIYATQTLTDAILAAEDGYQRAVANFFGAAETERDRRFPNTVVTTAQPLVIDGVPFIVTEQGAVESEADCVWTSPSLPGAVFSGDLIIHRTHLSLVQGNSAGYLETAERLAAGADPNVLFFTGHGGLVPVGAVARQLRYLRAYRNAVRELAQGRPALEAGEKAQLVERMLAVEPATLLSFLIPSGADPVARELAGGHGLT